jgi:hypothetical protein
LTDGVRDDARIAPDEVAADEEDELAVERGVDVEAELARLPERLVEVGAELRSAGPERGEVGAALVGRVLAPEQLAAHLVVEADQVGLDEAVVGLQQRRHVGSLDQAEAGDHPLAVIAVQRLVHGVAEARMGHHRLDAVVVEPAGPQPAGQPPAAGGEARADACRHGERGIELGHELERRDAQAVARDVAEGIVEDELAGDRLQAGEQTLAGDALAAVDALAQPLGARPEVLEGEIRLRSLGLLERLRRPRTQLCEADAQPCRVIGGSERLDAQPLDVARGEIEFARAALPGERDQHLHEGCVGRRGDRGLALGDLLGRRR